MELLGILLKIAATYLVLSTVEGRKKVPYTEVNVSFGGMSLEELRRKKVKVIIWGDGEIEVTSPKEYG